MNALGYRLLGIEYLPGSRGVLLRFYIDNDAGITLNDCARVSQQVTGVLDVENPVRDIYELEVSSPGLDRPLFTLEQIKQYAGHMVSLKLYEKLQGRMRFRGKVKTVHNGAVVILAEDTEYLIPAGMIKKARLVPRI